MTPSMLPTHLSEAVILIKDTPCQILCTEQIMYSIIQVNIPQALKSFIVLFLIDKA